MTHRVHILLLSLALGLWSAPASAQELQDEPSFDALDDLSKRRIAELLDLIEEAVASERFERALSYLDEAQQLFDHPEFWLDRARVLEAMGRPHEAAGWIKRFAQVRPDSPRTTTLSRRAEALENMPDRPERLSASGILRITSTPPGATVSFTSQRAPLKGTTPTVAIPVVRTQTFVVQVSKQGYLPQERTIVIEPDQVRSLDFELMRDPDAREARAAVPDASLTRGRGAGPWLLWGLGAAGITGMVLSSQHDARLDERDARGQDVSRERSRTRGVFIVSTAATFTGIVGGTLLWIARAPRTKRGAELVVSPGAAAVRVRF